MDAIVNEIIHLCTVEVKADKRRAKAAREVREARRKRLALVEMLAQKNAPRGVRGETTTEKTSQKVQARRKTRKSKTTVKFDLSKAGRMLAKHQRPDYLKGGKHE